MAKGSKNLVTTSAIVAGVVLLGIPIAIGIISLAKAHVPDVVLGTKTIDAGPSKTKELTFGLQTGAEDAVLTSAYLSIISSILLAVSVGALREVKQFSRIAGMASLGIALANLVGQLGCAAAWAIMTAKDESKVAKEGEIKFEDGKYVTGGRMFTRESWACSMKEFFGERENWAADSCSDLKMARFLTIASVLFSIITVGVVYWQIHAKGGFGWLKNGKEKARYSEMQKLNSDDA